MAAKGSWRETRKRDKMAAKSNPRKVVKELGGAREVHVGLKEFSSRVRALEAIRAELTKKHPNKWVAMNNGDAVIVADSLEDVLKEMDDLGISRKGSLVEFLDTEHRNMVL